MSLEHLFEEIEAVAPAPVDELKRRVRELERGRQVRERKGELKDQNRSRGRSFSRRELSQMLESTVAVTGWDVAACQARLHPLFIRVVNDPERRDFVESWTKRRNDEDPKECLGRQFSPINQLRDVGVEVGWVRQLALGLEEFGSAFGIEVGDAARFILGDGNHWLPPRELNSFAKKLMSRSKKERPTFSNCYLAQHVLRLRFLGGKEATGGVLHALWKNSTRQQEYSSTAHFYRALRQALRRMEAPSLELMTQAHPMRQYGAASCFPLDRAIVQESVPTIHDQAMQLFWGLDRELLPAIHPQWKALQYDWNYLCRIEYFSPTWSYRKADAFRNAFIEASKGWEPIPERQNISDFSELGSE